MHRVEAFVVQEPHGSVQPGALAADHLIPNPPVCPLAIPVSADGSRQIEHDRDDRPVIHPGEIDKRPPRLRLNIRRVNHGDPAGLKPLGGNQMQNLEGRVGRGLVALVVRHQRAAQIGGEYLGRLKVPLRKR